VIRENEQLTRLPARNLARSKLLGAQLNWPVWADPHLSEWGPGNRFSRLFAQLHRILIAMA